jgi:hypothetical protein
MLLETVLVCLQLLLPFRSRLPAVACNFFLSATLFLRISAEFRAIDGLAYVNPQYDFTSRVDQIVSEEGGKRGLSPLDSKNFALRNPRLGCGV